MIKIIMSILILVASSVAQAQVSPQAETLCEMKGQHAENKAKARGKPIKDQEAAYENAVFECTYAAMCMELVALGGDVRTCSATKKR